MSAAPASEIRAAGQRVLTKERELAEAVRVRDEAVRTAVAGGAPKSVVAREAGISRERVRQIVVAT